MSVILLSSKNGFIDRIENTRKLAVIVKTVMSSKEEISSLDGVR